MDAVSAISSTTTTTTDADTTAALGSLSSNDFLELLLTEINSQDPLEPMGTQELLDQISAIRDIEQSTTMTASLTELTDSLAALTGQQHYSAASALIGQYVSGVTADGETVQGVVAAVRFDESGQALLQFSDGTELPLTGLNTMASPLEAARQMEGLLVGGTDRRSGQDEAQREGVVTGYSVADDGQVLLELDSGDELRLADVQTIAAVAA